MQQRSVCDFWSSLLWCQQDYDFSLASTSETKLLLFLCVLAFEAGGSWQLVSTWEEKEHFKSWRNVGL